MKNVKLRPYEGNFPPPRKPLPISEEEQSLLDRTEAAIKAFFQASIDAEKEQ